MDNGSINQVIHAFATKAIELGGWMELDRLYLQNKISGLIGVKKWQATVVVPLTTQSTEDLIHTLCKYACEHRTISDEPSAKYQLQVELSDLLTPPPSVVNAFFAQHYASKPEAATEYFHQLMTVNGYIQPIESHVQQTFTVPTDYGLVPIAIESRSTVNTNQPVQQQKTHCIYCMENEGFAGDNECLSLRNQRIIRMNLNGESWGLQYVARPQLIEECLIVAEQHEAASATNKQLEQLLQIVDIFPHYFIAANEHRTTAHAHYHGGMNSSWPLAKAEMVQEETLQLFPEVTIGSVKWPLSVIRLQSSNSQMIKQAADYLIQKWQNQSDEPLNRPFVTIVARKSTTGYLLELILRKETAPDLTLVEILGQHHLSNQVLDQWQVVEQAVRTVPVVPAFPTISWTSYLSAIDLPATQEQITEWIQQALGLHYTKRLEQAAAFPKNKAGQLQFQQFMK